MYDNLTRTNLEFAHREAEKRIAELENRCANYETRISQMERGTCDACKETEKDKRLEALEAENAELKEDLRNKKLAIQNRKGRIKELEGKINVLLSCKNCPENKGGFICEKEYENKCLAQKIQFIKELQEEIAELKTKVTALENANRAMVKELDDMTSGGVSVLKNVVRSKEQLTKAKEIIKDYMIIVKGGNITVCSVPEENRCINVLKLNEQAEQFLKEL